MLSKVYSSLEFTCQLLKPASSPSGWMTTQMLSPLPGWSAQLLAPWWDELKNKEVSGQDGRREQMITAKYSPSLQTYSLPVSEQLWGKHTGRMNRCGNGCIFPATAFPTLQTWERTAHPGPPCSWSSRCYTSSTASRLLMPYQKKKKSGLTQTSKCNGIKTIKI